MLKAMLITMVLALLTFAADRPANAVTLDKFFFEYGLDTLTLTLTGAVEPDGFIQLADLRDFSLRVETFPEPLTKSDVSLFSFDTTGGASSLDFIVSDPTVPVLVCGGAAVALFAPCNPSGEAPPDATATFILGSLSYSPDVPTVTLLSSTTVPEPPTWTMLVAGLAGIALARAARRVVGGV